MTRAMNEHFRDNLKDEPACRNDPAVEGSAFGRHVKKIMCVPMQPGEQLTFAPIGRSSDRRRHARRSTVEPVKYDPSGISSDCGKHCGSCRHFWLLTGAPERHCRAE